MRSTGIDRREIKSTRKTCKNRYSEKQKRKNEREKRIEWWKIQNRVEKEIPVRKKPCMAVMAVACDKMMLVGPK